MKLQLTKLYFLLSLSILIFSCKSESDPKESVNNDKGISCYPNNERPTHAISYQDIASMFKEYDNGQKKVLDKYITSKTKGRDSVATVSQFFTLSELKQYIAYIEKLSDEKEIELTGIKIFTAAYPSDYEKKEYRNRVSFILAPTTNIGVNKNVAYEPLKSGIKKPVSMQSVLDKYADEATKNVNRASIFNFDLMQEEPSSALNRGELGPPYQFEN
ncbi:hypothetical protein [uncultured Polaribacter sp.]|uniref:hypothetical protein n=1 Tax=uncultured Polaribacter sp. TaxID=174711 RepID=UPI00260A637F|nr:hypothetical protein [uncultured Polaribacter sp.]